MVSRQAEQISKTVSGSWVRRGFKSLPLRSNHAGLEPTPAAAKWFAVSRTFPVSPWKSVDVYGSPLVSFVTGAPLAHLPKVISCLLRQHCTRHHAVALQVFRRPALAVFADPAIFDCHAGVDRTSVKSFTDVGDCLRSLRNTPRRQPQAGVNTWYADYPAASNFFSILSCRKAKDPATNASLFCSRSLDGQIGRALARASRDRASAAALWTKIVCIASDSAAIVPVYTPRSVDLVSKRAGNYQHQPLCFALSSLIRGDVPHWS
jgi:hypothetical protein